MQSLARSLSASLALLVAGVASGQQCLQWSTQFSTDDFAGGVALAALTMQTDGGPTLFVAGTFMSVGGVASAGVAGWNGFGWYSLGGGIVTSQGSARQVTALAEFDDDGAGPNPAKLYAAGSFQHIGAVDANSVASWDGTAWTPVGPVVTPAFTGTIYALAVFDDDGAGPNPPSLYASGDVVIAGHQTGIMRFDGATWVPVDQNANAPSLRNMRALVVHDDGSGPTLFSAGDLGVVKLVGGAWVSIAPALYTLDAMYTLASYDDGTGTRLYVGGRFNSIGAVTASDIAAWDGSTWSAVGTAFVPTAGTPGTIRCLRVFDDGATVRLYAGGNFQTHYGFPFDNIASWDGTAWSAAGAGVNGEVDAVEVYPQPDGPSLFMFGGFPNAGTVSSPGMTEWTGAQYIGRSNAVTGWSPQASAWVGALTGSSADGDQKLYAGGYFQNAGSNAVQNVARWDGGGWSPLDGTNSGTDGGAVYALSSIDSGSLAGLYVDGQFLGTVDDHRTISGALISR